MAWTAPMTAASNATFTAAQWNTHVRDNLLMTEAGKATTAGRYFVSTAANVIAERYWSSAAITNIQSTTSTTYTNLASLGPSVTVTTGASAIVFWSLLQGNTTPNAQSWSSVAVSGATSPIAASNAWATMFDGAAASAAPDNMQGIAGFHQFALTPGSNTFTVQYRVSSGTGQFSNRSIQVMSF